MTKRIVSGIFILTALGALGVILAGALTSGEQLIVRFLTAVIVAALGLYVISDLRLQADDDSLSNRTGGTRRTGKLDAPPNSTAAFMATVTRKVDSRTADTGAASEASLRFNHEAPHQTSSAPNLKEEVDPAETTVVSAEELEAATTGQSRESAATPDTRPDPVKRPMVPVSSHRVKTPDQVPAVPAKLNGPPDRSIPAGAETIVASEEELHAAPDHALAGVGAVASAAGSGDGRDGDGSAPAGSSDKGEFFSSQSIDISDLFIDEGAKSNLANGAGSNPGRRFGSGGSEDGGRNGTGAKDESDHSQGGANGADHTIDSTNGAGEQHSSNGAGSNGSSTNGTGSAGHWANDHISGRLSESSAATPASLDDTAADGVDTSRSGAAPMFDPTERVYDPEGLDPAALTGEDSPPSAEFEYSGDLYSADYVWPAAPTSTAPEPHPFEKASAAYEAAKRKLEEAESTATATASRTTSPTTSPTTASGRNGRPGSVEGSNVASINVSTTVEPATDDAPLAPIIDLRDLAEPEENDIDAAINAGEVEVIATLIEQGMLSTSGPISDREVRTMVYVAFTSNELRKLLLAGGTPDGPNYGLDLGPVELFDERIHAPAPKTLYTGSPAPQPSAEPTPQIVG